MSEENIFSLKICRIAPSLDDDFIKSELMKTYSGILHVERVYREDEETGVEYPTLTVQVDFQSIDDVKTILQDRQIIFNGVARKIYPISEIPRGFFRKVEHETKTMCSMTERDLFDYFNRDAK